MVTLLELTQQISEADQNIIDAHKAIKAIVSVRPANSNEYKDNNKELRRLKLIVKRQTENRALLSLVKSYISSGVQMEGIKSQRNSLMIKLSTIDERLKYGENGS